MLESPVRSRLILAIVLVCLLPIPLLLEPLCLEGPSQESSYPLEPSNIGFAGKALLSVPPPGKDDIPLSNPNVSIERANYIGADGIMITLERWWDDVDLYKNTLQRYKDAGFLVIGH